MIAVVIDGIDGVTMIVVTGCVVVIGVITGFGRSSVGGVARRVRAVGGRVIARVLVDGVLELLLICGLRVRRVGRLRSVGRIPAVSGDVIVVRIGPAVGSQYSPRGNSRSGLASWRSSLSKKAV